jgi:hypothetical protein
LPHRVGLAEAAAAAAAYLFRVQLSVLISGRRRWAHGESAYSGDFALDLRGAISAVSRLPFDEERLVDAICEAEPSPATNPADEDYTIWLVLADQFEKRGIFSRRVRERALAIIEGEKDAPVMQALHMRAADVRKRAGRVAELRARLLPAAPVRPLRGEGWDDGQGRKTRYRRSERLSSWIIPQVGGILRRDRGFESTFLQR